MRQQSNAHSVGMYLESVVAAVGRLCTVSGVMVVCRVSCRRRKAHTRELHMFSTERVVVAAAAVVSTSDCVMESPLRVTCRRWWSRCCVACRVASPTFLWPRAWPFGGMEVDLMVTNAV